MHIKLKEKLSRGFHKFSRRQLIIFGAVLIVVLTGLAVWLVVRPDNPKDEVPAEDQSEAVLDDQTTTDNPSDVPAENPEAKITTPPAAVPKPVVTSLPFMFGVGTELDKAITARITKESSIKLLTSWYNGTNDLGFMNGWRTTQVPKAYAAGYALHLIIYSNDTEQNLTTKYGAACGRAYPLSQQFITDVTQLAQNFSGGKLYVSMFTEFQTYPCSDNNWTTGENYYKELKDQYTAAKDIFHQYAPGSQVSLTWGGWQANWDDPGQGGGRSLIGKFSDVLNASDFQSFQAMANTGNTALITGMTKALQPYSGGVMIAHYKPDSGSQSAFNADMTSIFTPANVASLQQLGLFAFSFMDTVNINSSESSYQTVRNIINTYAR
jgi:hypothetical protein